MSPGPEPELGQDLQIFLELLGTEAALYLSRHSILFKEQPGSEYSSRGLGDLAKAYSHLPHVLGDPATPN